MAKVKDPPALAKTDVSFFNTMSRANCDFSAANQARCPSSNRSESFQAIISEDQQKPLRNMISLSCTPIQAKVVIAEFENVLKIVERGCNIDAQWARGRYSEILKFSKKQIVMQF